MNKIWWRKQWRGLKTGKSIWLAVLVAIAVSCLWAVLYWINDRLPVGLEMDIKNLYPSFSVVQTIFTGLAFWGVFVNIVLLKKQVRHEKKKYKEECSRSDEKFNKQDFESKFWNMLNCLNDVREKIWIDVEGGGDFYFEFKLGKDRIQGIEMIRYINNKHLYDIQDPSIGIDVFMNKGYELSTKPPKNKNIDDMYGWGFYEGYIGSYFINDKNGNGIHEDDVDQVKTIKSMFVGLHACGLFLESWMTLFFNIILFIRESTLKEDEKQRYYEILKCSICKEESNILIHLGMYINDERISKARNFSIEKRILFNDFEALSTNKVFLQLMKGMYGNGGRF